MNLEWCEERFYMLWNKCSRDTFQICRHVAKPLQNKYPIKIIVKELSSKSSCSFAADDLKCNFIVPVTKNKTSTQYHI